MSKVNTFGVELEKVVSSNNSQEPHRISRIFFNKLVALANKRKTKPHYHYSDIEPETILGVVSQDLGEQGLDNGFNLLETALPYQTSLTKLYQLIELDIQSSQKALADEESTLINMSNHPLGKTDMKTYKKMVAPKGVYPYIWFRGWDHAAGIDAKAQNSPATGISADQAADAVSAIIGAGAAFVALFANSPLEEGKLSGYKESRLKIWDRMMKNSKVEGDRLTATFPKKPFKNLAQYFNWMFGRKTGIHFVLAENEEGKTDYKGVGERILIVEDNPSVLKFLSKKSWKAFYLKDTKKKTKQYITVNPNISHMEAMQFAQFSGARIRYALDQKNFPLKDFIAACQKTDKNEVEKIFEKFAKYIYIEGRDPGANFPDQEILNEGQEIAKSVAISASALQAGLINNLGKTLKYLDKYPWNMLGQLRESSIKDGLQGHIGKLKVETFTQDILNLAKEGLSKNEQWMLAYPEWVLSKKQNGADRAISFIKKYEGSKTKAIKELVKLRKVVEL